MTTESASTRLFFTESQLELMRCILDRIVPAEGKMPGAGELGVADYVDRAAGGSAELKRLFKKGLAQVEVAAHAQYGAEFTSLAPQQQDSVLAEVELGEPAFFSALVGQAYNGYYTNPRVITLLDLEARPPQPRGHTLDAGDLTLIENVKKRGIAYRAV